MAPAPKNISVPGPFCSCFLATGSVLSGRLQCQRIDKRPSSARPCHERQVEVPVESTCRMQRFSDSAMSRCSDVPMFRCSDVPMSRCPDVPISRYPDIPISSLPAFFHRAVCRRIARVAPGFRIVRCRNTLTSIKHQSESMKHLHTIVDIHPHTLAL